MPRACELTPGRGLARSYTNRLPSGPADEGRWYLFPVAAAGYRLVFLLLMPKPLFRQGSESCLDVLRGEKGLPRTWDPGAKGQLFSDPEGGGGPRGAVAGEQKPAPGREGCRPPGKQGGRADSALWAGVGSSPQNGHAQGRHGFCDHRQEAWACRLSSLSPCSTSTLLLSGLALPAPPK